MRMAGEEEKEENSKSQQGHQNMFLSRQNSKRREQSSESGDGTRTNVLLLKRLLVPRQKLYWGNHSLEIRSKLGTVLQFHWPAQYTFSGACDGRKTLGHIRNHQEESLPLLPHLISVVSGLFNTAPYLVQ